MGQTFSEKSKATAKTKVRKKAAKHQAHPRAKPWGKTTVRIKTEDTTTGKLFSLEQEISLTVNEALAAVQAQSPVPAASKPSIDKDAALATDLILLPVYKKLFGEFDFDQAGINVEEAEIFIAARARFYGSEKFLELQMERLRSVFITNTLKGLKTAAEKAGKSVKVTEADLKPLAHKATECLWDILRRFLKKVAAKLKAGRKEYAAQLIAECDTQKDGKIKIEEWIAGYRRVVEGSMKPWMQEIDRILSLYIRVPLPPTHDTAT